MAAILPAYDIHKCIFLNDNCCQMSSKFVAQNPIGNKSALHDSGIGLAPTRWQIITGTNVDPFYLGFTGL